LGAQSETSALDLAQVAGPKSRMILNPSLIKIKERIESIM